METGTNPEGVHLRRRVNSELGDTPQTYFYYLCRHKPVGHYHIRSRLAEVAQRNSKEASCGFVRIVVFIKLYHCQLAKHLVSTHLRQRFPCILGLPTKTMLRLLMWG